MQAEAVPAQQPAAKRQRHSWGEAVRDFYKTERECPRCGIVKVTHHEAVVWVDYVRGAEFWGAGPVPPCEPARGTGAAE